MRPLVPPHIQTLQPYVPGKPIEETEREYGVRGAIKLASNENPLGPSLYAIQAIEAAARKVNLYPDGSSYYLVQKLAAFLGVRPDEVFLGNGSNEIIELLIRTFTTADDEAILCRGSFLMYKVALQSHGRRFAEVPMMAGYRYDLGAIADRITPRTRIIFLANPDNPTGTAFSRSELDAFLVRVPPDCLVALDEAYFEYVDWPDYPNGLNYFRSHSNLVVLRTYSKIYGLAGIRLGYALMQSSLSEYMNRTRLPFNLSSLAQAAGIAALDDVDHVQATRQVTRRGLHYLQGELQKLGLTVPQSHANFVFVDLGRPANAVYEQLLRRGIITRPIPAYGFPNALRISVGLPEHNEMLLAALREIL